MAIYMPMIPEVAVIMLACARLGAPHTVVFGASPRSPWPTASTTWGPAWWSPRTGAGAGGAWCPSKPTPTRPGESQRGAHLPGGAPVGTTASITMQEGRDVWWHEATAESQRQGQTTCDPEPLDSEHPLYVLYTSGSTGKPKGILHTTGGYLVHTSLTHKWIFDLKEDDVYWCTADVGWVTGHSYIVYGPLCNGATCVMFEGTPDFPDRDRFWAVIARHKVTILYTAPTAIRSFMRWGEEYPARHDMSSLRLLGTVGEPINPEAWVWYRQNIGGGRCPVVDTWWQTETGAIMISPLPGITTCKPGSATFPFPGIEADVVNEAGRSVPLGGGGYLVIKRPWPGMLRTCGGTTSATCRPTGAGTPGSTSPGTAASGTRRGTSGSWVGSTTCSTSPPTGSGRWSWRAPSSATPLLRRRR